MIIDKICNLGNYTELVKNLAEALTFINGNLKLPDGRHEFAGGVVIACAVESLPPDEKEFEAHRNFADVMVILQNDETVSYRRIEELTLTKPYDAANDIAMYSGEGDDIAVTVPSGYFYIVLPGEGHKPGIRLAHSANNFRKYIIKCRQ